jgi:hypothetical protein
VGAQPEDIMSCQGLRGRVVERSPHDKTKIDRVFESETNELSKDALVSQPVEIEKVYPPRASDVAILSPSFQIVNDGLCVIILMPGTWCFQQPSLHFQW